MTGACVSTRARPRPVHRARSRRVILIPERAALGYPAGRAHRHNPASRGGYGWITAGPSQNYDFREVAAKTLKEAISSALELASNGCVRTPGH
jgi:hypothetical protein